MQGQLEYRDLLLTRLRVSQLLCLVMLWNNKTLMKMPCLTVNNNKNTEENNSTERKKNLPIISVVNII